MEYAFKDTEAIHVIDITDDDINRYDVSKNKVVIFDNINNDEINDCGILNTMKIRGQDYELKVIIGKRRSDEELDEWKFDAYVYSRHGDIYDKWWFQNRTKEKKYLPIKVKNQPRFDEDDLLTLVYGRCNDNTMTQQGRELMRYIGGQTHIICETHELPLIPVPDRKAKCQCGTKEHLRCPDLDCTVCICKKCAAEKNQNIVNKIAVNNKIDESEEDLSIGSLESGYS